MRLPSQDEIIYCDVRSSMGAQACTHLPTPCNSPIPAKIWHFTDLSLLQAALQSICTNHLGLQETYTAVGTATHHLAELYKKPEDVQAQNLVSVFSSYSYRGYIGREHFFSVGPLEKKTRMLAALIFMFKNITLIRLLFACRIPKHKDILPLKFQHGTQT